MGGKKCKSCYWWNEIVGHEKREGYCHVWFLCIAESGSCPHYSTNATERELQIEKENFEEIQKGFYSDEFIKDHQFNGLTNHIKNAK